jgi:hypothetical protein
MSRLLRLFAALLVGACLSCHKQPSFSIPVCDGVDSNCACQITGWIICDRVCVDPTADPGNCGSCGNSCSGVCAGGSCQTDCGGAPQCGNRCVSATDPYNCGGCGNLCDGACVNGACGQTDADCTAKGQTVCDGVCSDLSHDADNCGHCGRVCANGCDFGECCIGKICNGLCAHILVDNLNCGDCNVRCGMPEVCVNGFCVQ